MIRVKPRAYRAYGLRFGRRRGTWSGLGVLNYYDLLAQANLQSCDPHDIACVSDNVAKQAAVEDFWAAHQSTGVPNDTKLTFAPQTQAQVAEFYNPDVIQGGNVVDTRGLMFVSAPELPAASSGGGSGAGGSGVTPVAARPGQLYFTTSRGGTSLQVGDSWTVKITGATPGQQVVVRGGKNGQSDMTPMGTIDANGNFSLSGTISADQVGSWSETWLVGPASAGSFSFTVAAPAVAKTPAGQVIINSSGVQQPAGGFPSLLSGFDLSSIPWWGWVGAGAVVLFAFGGGRGR